MTKRGSPGLIFFLLVIALVALGMGTGVVQQALTQIEETR